MKNIVQYGNPKTSKALHAASSYTTTRGYAGSFNLYQQMFINPWKFFDQNEPQHASIRYVLVCDCLYVYRWTWTRTPRRPRLTGLRLCQPSSSSRTGTSSRRSRARTRRLSRPRPASSSNLDRTDEMKGGMGERRGRWTAETYEHVRSHTHAVCMYSKVCFLSTPTRESSSRCRRAFKAASPRNGARGMAVCMFVRSSLAEAAASSQQHVVEVLRSSLSPSGC